MPTRKRFLLLSLTLIAALAKPVQAGAARIPSMTAGSDPARPGAKDYSLQSPNGRLQVNISNSDGLTFNISLDGKELLPSAQIGLTLQADRTRSPQTQQEAALIPVPLIGKDGNGTVRLSGRSHISETIDAPFYRQKQFHVEANELTLRLSDGFSVVFRAYDEGVAYRFRHADKKAITIADETADYRFGGDKRAWLSYSTNEEKPFAMAFQNIYHETLLDSARQQPTFLPATVDCGTAKVTVLESDAQHYPGMFLKADGDELRGVFAPYPKRMELYQWRHQSYVAETEDFIAKSDGTMDYPWRIFAVTESDTQMPTCNLVYALARPNKIGDTSWIRPGKVAWDWWNDWNLKGVDFVAGQNTLTYKYYIDFAAEHGIEYVVLDEGWYDSNSGDIMHAVADVDVEQLIDYGAAKGVAIVLWAVFNVMDENLEEICEHYAAMGVKGFKVDFMDRNDQTATEMVERLADCCARHRLILDLHGIYTPVGLERTYPNILNYESVFGMEEVRWGDIRNDHPRYDVTFPYIRMMSGYVDFTPGAMRNGTKWDWKAIYTKPVSMGTRCHQAATYIVYDSPFTMLCDSPTNYEADEPFTRYISALPTVFDETKVLQGELGEYIVTLRNRGGEYFLGALTNWDARDISVPLDFLSAGNYTATILRDGPNAEHDAEDYVIEAQEVDSGSTLQVHLASGGGFAITIKSK